MLFYCMISIFVKLKYQNSMKNKKVPFGGGGEFFWWGQNLACGGIWVFVNVNFNVNKLSVNNSVNVNKLSVATILNIQVFLKIEK